MQYLDQQRLLLEEQLKAKDEIIEKLVVDLSNQEQKITSLTDEMLSRKAEFEDTIQTLQGQVMQAIEHMGKLVAMTEAVNVPKKQSLRDQRLEEMKRVRESLFLL